MQNSILLQWIFPLREKVYPNHAWRTHTAAWQGHQTLLLTEFKDSGFPFSRQNFGCIQNSLATWLTAVYGPERRLYTQLCHSTSMIHWIFNSTGPNKAQTSTRTVNLCSYDGDYLSVLRFWHGALCSGSEEQETGHFFVSKSHPPRWRARMPVCVCLAELLDLLIISQMSR